MSEVVGERGMVVYRDRTRRLGVEWCEPSEIANVVQALMGEGYNILFHTLYEEQRQRSTEEYELLIEKM